MMNWKGFRRSDHGLFEASINSIIRLSGLRKITSDVSKKHSATAGSRNWKLPTRSWLAKLLTTMFGQQFLLEFIKFKSNQNNVCMETTHSTGNIHCHRGVNLSNSP